MMDGWLAKVNSSETFPTQSEGHENILDKQTTNFSSLKKADTTKLCRSKKQRLQTL